MKLIHAVVINFIPTAVLDDVHSLLKRKVLKHAVARAKSSSTRESTGHVSTKKTPKVVKPAQSEPEQAESDRESNESDDDDQGQGSGADDEENDTDSADSNGGVSTFVRKVVKMSGKTMPGQEESDSSSEDDTSLKQRGGKNVKLLMRMNNVFFILLFVFFYF